MYTARVPSNITKEEDGSTRISLALPGFKREDISITVEDDHLIISGTPQEQPKPKTLFDEGFRIRPFQNIFQVRTDRIDYAKVSAVMKDGILQISLPERADRKPQIIQISG